MREMWGKVFFCLSTASLSEGSPQRPAGSSLLTVLLAVVVSLSAHPIIRDSLFVHEGIDNFLWLNFGHSRGVEGVRVACPSLRLSSKCQVLISFSLGSVDALFNPFFSWQEFARARKRCWFSFELPSISNPLLHIEDDWCALAIWVRVLPIRHHSLSTCFNVCQFCMKSCLGF